MSGMGATGAGGSGGGAVIGHEWPDLTVKAIAEPGKPGNNGGVWLQVGVPRPIFLNKLAAERPDPTLLPDATIHFDAFVGDLSKACTQAAGNCPRELFAVLQSIKDSTLTIQQRARILFSSEGVESLKQLGRWLPKPERVLMQIFNSIPGDTRTGFVHAPILNPAFGNMADADLQVLYGNLIAAILFLQQLPSANLESNVIAINNISSYANRVKEEMVLRERRNMRVPSRSTAPSSGGGGENRSRGGEFDERRRNQDRLREILREANKPEPTGCVAVCEFNHCSAFQC
jgi:hypothetical protein